MLETYKGRQLRKGNLVKVYYNVKKKAFSVKDAKSGLVLAHGNNIQIREPKFEVSQKGRDRVLRDREKNVHAYVIGEFEGVGELDRPVMSQYSYVTYDPYKQDKFTKATNPTKDANEYGYEFAILRNRRVYAR